MKVCVMGLWHLGSVTAACAASLGHALALEKALTKLVERPADRRRMGASNAAKARAKYALPQVADKMVQILAQV